MEPVHGGRDDWSSRSRTPHLRRGRNGARPRRTGRRQGGGSKGGGLTWAAMEPVHGGRDDASRRAASATSSAAPQWSPSTEDGTTAVCAVRSPLKMSPQWSPSTEDGTTLPALGESFDEGVAAMEPVHGGRDDASAPPTGPAAASAAMEPVHGGRDDYPVRRRDREHEHAAMEPVHGGRDDPGTLSRPRTCITPQWSPSTEDGTTGLSAS